MIQVSKILSELYGTGKSVVGFRQPINPTYAILTSPNTVCLSGIYLESGIVTIENIKNCQEYASISAANFNTQLGQFIQDAIISACNLVFNFNDQLETGLLYDFDTIKTDALNNSGDFVGYEINVLKKEDITCILNNIICEFDAAGSLTIKLFHSSQRASLQSQVVTLTEKNAVEQYVNWALDDHKKYGGTYYIGYLTNGLTPKAINRGNYYSYIPRDFKDINFRPVKVSGYNSTSLFDIEDIEYTSDTYGLNFGISSYNDFTRWIITNKNQFAQLIKMQFHADMLKMMINSNQNNGVELNVKNNAMRELEGILTEQGKVYSQGILRKLENEAEKIRDQFFKENEGKIINGI